MVTHQLTVTGRVQDREVRRLKTDVLYRCRPYYATNHLIGHIFEVHMFIHCKDTMGHTVPTKPIWGWLVIPIQFQTSGQSNSTKERIAAADGLFIRIRQVAPVCPPMWAHWRHLANTIELVLPSAHPSPQPKRQIDRFSRFCTACHRKSQWATLSPKWHHDRFNCFHTGDCRVSLHFTMGRPFPLKIARGRI